MIPGLDGYPGLLLGSAPRLFPGLRALAFDHFRDAADGGVEGLADRALAILDADPEGAAPAYVCAESFGGTVALTLARRYPSRVRGLILLNAFGRYPAILAQPSRLGMAVWRVLGNGVAGHIIRLWRPISAVGSVGRHCPPDIKRAYLGQPAPPLPGYRAKCAISLTFDARSWLGEITGPTFILIGSFDTVVPNSAGRELARLMPNARLHRVPGGHLVYIVRADLAGALISGWRASECGEAAPPLAASAL